MTVEPAVRARIEAELAAVEAGESVRILLAVESGSRAWGFPSPDSDYDCRFVYVRRLDDYLSLAPPRDVIERPLDGELDVGGWDLRKALGLAVRSNAVLLEWLSSPVVYRREEVATAALSDLARSLARLPALAYHYDRLARGAWSPGDGPVRLKSYFYALRPALALRWMARHGTPPPMDLSSLLSGNELSAALRESVERHRRDKETASETATVPRCPVIEAFLAQVLSEDPPWPGRPDKPDAVARADALFRRLVLGDLAS